MPTTTEQRRLVTGGPFVTVTIHTLDSPPEWDQAGQRWVVVYNGTTRYIATLPSDASVGRIRRAIANRLNLDEATNEIIIPFHYVHVVILNPNGPDATPVGQGNELGRDFGGRPLLNLLAALRERDFRVVQRLRVGNEFWVSVSPT